MGDILDQMIVTAANGECMMLFNLIENAEKEGKREEYEARRMDTLMRLGVTNHEFGPMVVTSVGVSFDKR